VPPVTTAAVRRACLELVARAVASGAVRPGEALPLADLWAAYVGTGRVAGDAIALVPIAFRLQRKGPAMQVQIPVGFDARVTIAPPVDAAGQATKFGGPVVWEGTADQLFTASAAQPDGMVGLIVTTGSAEGDGEVDLSAPAGPEADAPVLTNTIAVSVIAGDAVALNAQGVELVRKEPAA
jgi:hypothetical protein